MICDDSSVIRSLISRILREEPSIEIVASVANGAVAVDTLKQTGADVIVLDVEMPVMDGLTALPLLLQIDPSVKVIVASALTSSGAAIALKAIRTGAADCLHKPRADTREQFAHEIRAKVLAYQRRPRSAAGSSPIAARTTPAIAVRPMSLRRPKLIAFGSSTGGPQALFSIFGALSACLTQPLLLTQHMPPIFTKSLAEHLDRLGHRPCVEAEDGMMLLPNRLHVAPGDRHMLVEAVGDQFRARLTDSPPENSCRPSVDPMLRSAVVASRGQVLAVILTGMGRDGAAGARDVVDAGGAVLAQDEATSVVWGMPGAVARDGLCQAVLPLDGIAAKIRELAGAA
ncbi:chemotaxis response regulator protein-glutamate methylesterase [Acetobacteraceae bacterium KSS8]|uniref:Protein-glutamate methylesterase/protein-glutamine glutaminase n=2 Tax=Endosaccharibacter trunci TaxID=2812733 RepID=A0ABT1W6D3_9PROT|nr:chemotaxis response regulator protein-glutamate methylesterase [Acetobacteraceae bacterium KSS8]